MVAKHYHQRRMKEQKANLRRFLILHVTLELIWTEIPKMKATPLTRSLHGSLSKRGGSVTYFSAIYVIAPLGTDI